MSNRAHISLKTKLAAALLALRDEKGELLIPHDDAKLMTAENIISLFHFDHFPIPHAEGGPDEPWNLVPGFIPPHRKKTAEQDVPGIAKRKRVADAFAEHRARMAAKAGQGDRASAIGAAQGALAANDLPAVREALAPVAKSGLMFPKPERRQKPRHPMRRKRSFSR